MYFQKTLLFIVSSFLFSSFAFAESNHFSDSWNSLRKGISKAVAPPVSAKSKTTKKAPAKPQVQKAKSTAPAIAINPGDIPIMEKGKIVGKISKAEYLQLQKGATTQPAPSKPVAKVAPAPKKAKEPIAKVAPKAVPESKKIIAKVIPKKQDARNRFSKNDTLAKAPQHELADDKLAKLKAIKEKTKTPAAKENKAKVNPAAAKEKPKAKKLFKGICAGNQKELKSNPKLAKAFRRSPFISRHDIQRSYYLKTNSKTGATTLYNTNGKDKRVVRRGKIQACLDGNKRVLHMFGSKAIMDKYSNIRLRGRTLRPIRKRRRLRRTSPTFTPEVFGSNN